MPITQTTLNLAYIAAAGSADTNPTALLPPGFVPVSAAELGFVPGPGQSLTNGTYRNGNAQAFVAKGMVDGQETLVLAFSGSDDSADWINNIVGINENYERYLPLIEAVDAAMAAGTFDQLVVTGHSLGGGMTQLYMATHPDPDIRAVTFGSPGAEIADAPDPRITNVVNLDDRTVWIGENRGAIGAVLAENPELLIAYIERGGVPLPGLSVEEALAILPQIDTDYENRGKTIYLPRKDGGSLPITDPLEALTIGPGSHPLGVYIARATAALSAAQGQAPEPLVAIATPADQFVLAAFGPGGALADAVRLPSPPPGWTLVGLGDANGDTGTDLFLAREDGGFGVLETRAGAVVGAMPIGQAAPGWQTAGIGDFDGDGRSDVAWRDPDGRVQAWLLDGEGLRGTVDLGRRPGGWSIVGVGDFDGDGRADLLWESPQGRIEAWLMDGQGGTENVAIGLADAGQHVVATGDLDGDGHSDILLQGEDGETLVWKIGPGASLVGAATIDGYGPGTRIEGTRDVSGDGRDDVIGQGEDGRLVVWLMEGEEIVGGEALARLPPDWQLIV